MILESTGALSSMRQWDLPTALMTNEQLYLAIGIPMLFNAAMMGLLVAYINSRFNETNERFRSVDQRFEVLTSASTTCEISGAPNFTAWKKSWTRG